MGMFLSALSPSRSATSSALDISEVALLIFGILLVLGLIGEYSPRWKLRLKLFETLVIIGVAGELIADGGIFVSSKHLQAISDFETARLQSENLRTAARLEEERKTRLELEQDL